MKIDTSDFLEFWSRYSYCHRINNPERLKTHLVKLILEAGDSTKLDDMIRSARTNKNLYAQIALEFYKFLSMKKGGETIDSDLEERKMFTYPIERQLEIAKYLHVPHTTREIEEEFSINERTVRADLQALEEGIKILGATIKITCKKEGRVKYYKTSMHPVFLPLNLTEVYALTTYLDKVVDKEDPNARVLTEVSDRIKLQLSDYAIDKLFPNEKETIQSRANVYYDDEEFARKEGFYMYLMKSGTKCKFFKDGQEYYGSLSLCENNRYRIILEDGGYIDTDLSDVDFVIEDMDYR